MHFPYALQLAYGRSRLPLVIATILLAVQIPVLIMLTARFGSVGSAASWLAVNVMCWWRNNRDELNPELTQLCRAAVRLCSEYAAVQ